MKETKRRRDLRISFVAQCLNKRLVSPDNMLLANEWFIEHGQVNTGFNNIIEFSRWLGAENMTRKERP